MILEKDIQEELQKYYTDLGFTVSREIATPVGIIDLIVHRDGFKGLIEVKERSSIKHAIGQLLSYYEYHSDADGLLIVYFSRDGKRRRCSTEINQVALKNKIRLNVVNDLLKQEIILKCLKKQHTQELEVLKDQNQNYLKNLDSLNNKIEKKTETFTVVTQSIQTHQAEYSTLQKYEDSMVADLWTSTGQRSENITF